MKYARVRIRPLADALSPVHAAIAACDDVEHAHLRLGGVNATGDRTYVFAIAGDVDAADATLAATEGVHNHEVLDRRGTHALVYAQTEPTDLELQVQAAFTRDSLVTGLPVELESDGSVVIRVMGRAGDLQRAIDEVRDVLPVAVERVGEYDGTFEHVTAALTDRQREAVETALAVGYYDVPRTATHETVAEELGCAPSTASEHLRKAEAALVEAAFDGL